jgi:biofilm PGA synthesis lipoprotein PgaB
MNKKGLPFQTVSLTWTGLHKKEPPAVVLMYHCIGDDNLTSGRITVTPAQFANELDTLLKDGYHIIPIEEYINCLDGKSTVPSKSIVITFDDGYESFYKYAYPELRKRHLSATNFIIVGSIGKKTAGNLPYLTWNEIIDMHNHGISFYPHSFDGHFLSKIYTTRIFAAKKPRGCLSGRMWIEDKKRYETESEFESRVTADLTASKRIMEKELKTPMLCFAWPYGADCPQSLKIANSIGFKYFFYIDNRKYYSNASYVCIPRVNAGSKSISPRILEFKIFIFKIQKYLI